MITFAANGNFENKNDVRTLANWSNNDWCGNKTNFASTYNLIGNMSKFNRVRSVDMNPTYLAKAEINSTLENVILSYYSRRSRLEH